MNHLVAIFGGAVSGAEAAHQLSQRGIQSVVFDQNILPYGKIEDGLPKWHAKLRDQEEAKINQKLNHELIHFVPKCALGKDLIFEDLVNNWGFSAILLAIGAWKDRPLPIEGIEKYNGVNFHYQNPFIYWFNHYHEPNFSGQSIDISDNAIVIGGGLASIDVCKALMMLTVEKALKDRGVETNIIELEKGINRKLDDLDLNLQELGVQPCTLFYRRRKKDMRLSPIPADSPEKLPKVQMIREKILNNAQKKFLFQVEELHVPVDKIVENGALRGLVFQETELIENKAIPILNSEKQVFSDLIISSIGSVPIPIKGIPMKWQTFAIDEDSCCRVQGFNNVFALGNAVTGRGNIIESTKHGRAVTSRIADEYLVESGELFQKEVGQKAESVAQNLENILGQIERLTPPNDDQRKAILEKVAALQKQVGYNGDYMKWVAKHLPVRLENMIKH